MSQLPESALWRVTRVERQDDGSTRVYYRLADGREKGAMFREGEFSAEAMRRAGDALVTELRVNPGQRVQP